jgi:flagella basal body P-ring formation protein FlgA
MRLLITFLLAVVLARPVMAETIVPADTIASRIAETIAARLPTPGHYRITLADPSYTLVLPAQAEGRYDIAALTFDPARHAFAATLAFTGAGGREYVRIAGGALSVIEVPVLTRDVAPGETIVEGNLTVTEIATAQAGAQLLTTARSIAGQAARRNLRAGMPLFAHDVKKPVVIKKGELITIVYAADGIELSAQGQAQADAGQGDTLAVLNTRSRRTVEGRVAGPGLAVVSLPNPTLAAR